MPRTLTLFLVFALGGATGIFAYMALPGLMYSAAGEPPANLVVISERLATSGQPSPSQLDTLAESGYQVVINLAPPTSIGAVRDEGYRLGQAGITYINIPVDFRAPEVRDFEQFAALLDSNRDRSVLVHCQTNKRASVFTFLYRVTRLGVDPDAAVEQVYAIWAPDENWQAFVEEVLQQTGTDFIM